MLGFSLFAIAGQASAADSGAVALKPAHEADYFHIALYPGAAVDEIAIVSNETASSLTLLTYPVDAKNTTDGVFVLGSQADHRAGVGSWTQLGSGSITVPAHSEMKIPFRLTVPAGTPPGDYAGGLIVQTPPEIGEAALLSNGDSLRVNSVQRVGVRIYLVVAGTADVQLKHGDLSWQRNGDTITFTLPVRNSGNTILHPVANLRVKSLIGLNFQVAFDTPENLLPGASLNMSAHVSKLPLFESGNAAATIKSEAGISRSETTVFFVPWLLILLSLIAMPIAGYGIFRVARFIRRNWHLLDWS